jgi:transcriptional regulator with XRE-family HTH domain
MSTYGERLRQRREAAGLSVRELARRSGLDDGYLSRIERGKMPPPQDEKLAKLDKALGTTLATDGALERQKVMMYVPSLVEGKQLTGADIRRNLERMFGNLAPQRSNALEDALAVLAAAVRANLATEFEFTISGQPQADGSRELVVNVGRVHRFRVPPEREPRTVRAGRSRKAVKR